MLVVCGEEVVSDDVKIVVRQLHEQEVKVRWRQFEGLPHVFMLLMGGLEHSKVALAEWAGFCREVVENKDSFKGQGEFIHVRDLSRKMVKLGELSELTREEGMVLMRKEREKRRVIKRKEGGKAKI